MNSRYRAILIILWSSLGVLSTPAAPPTRPATRPAEQPAGKWCGKVWHAPQQPKSNQPTTIFARVVPGMKRVTLLYQVVEPGAYIELKDPQYARNWTAVEMKPGDATAATDRFLAYTAQLPAELQKHRRLVRYRIRAETPGGAPMFWPVAAPDPDAPAGTGAPVEVSPRNFAYFVYDGLPPWSGAINPRAADSTYTEVTTFAPEALGRIQVYHLLGKKRSIENATWIEQDPSNQYKYTGTLVVDGRVYDHVRYRARGGIWRYGLGKNMWKIDLPPGESVKARDDYGRPYPVGWKKLNLRSCFQLGAYGHRGEQGMFEAVNFRLWNMLGVEAPHIHWIHFRIISEAEEAPADQYKGDFWGLYQAIANLDGRFLKTHNLPDGNIYKMEIGPEDELNHHGEGQPADFSDLKAFLRAQERTRPTEQWWRENLNLPSYYSYRSIIECVRHYDIGEGKNYSYYRNPTTGRWQVFPWDSDLSWADRMFGDGEEPLNSYVLGRPVFQVEYRNRLREVRDLLFNPEQMNRFIDQVAAIVRDPKDPTGGILEADRRKWDNHPRVNNHKHSGPGRFYKMSATGDFAGMVQLMKDYVVSRGFWIDQYLLKDPLIPSTPAATYTGPPGYPLDGLRFTPGAYKGRASMIGVQWRIAEIIAPDKVKADPRTPQPYEITPLWQSPESGQAGEVTIPPAGLKPGRTYRVRVRYRDSTNRCSHWSVPVEFTPGAAAGKPPAKAPLP